MRTHENKRLKMSAIYRGFLAVLLLSALALHIVYLAYSYRSMERQVQEEHERSLNQVVYATDRFTQEIEACANMLSVSPQIQQVLINRQEPDYLAYLSCQTLLNEFEMAPFNIYRIDLYGMESHALVTSSEGVFYQLEDAEQQQYDALCPFNPSDRAAHWTASYQGSEPPLVRRTRNENYLTLIKPVISLYTGKPKGVLLLSIKYNALSALSAPVQQEETLCASFDETTLFGTAPEGSAYRLVSTQSTSSGINFAYYYRFHEERVFSKRLISMIGLIAVLFLISFVLIVTISERRVRRPISKLLHGFEALENGHFETRLNTEGNVIFNELYQGFDHMAGHLQAAVEDLVAEKTRGRELKQRLLQMQIRPHFLYNIFNNMVWMTEQKKYDTLEQLVTATAGFYKTALNYGSEDILLLENKKQLEYYVRIQKFRFGDRFDLEIEMEDGAEFYQIPNLLLQPLVENAIVHGLRDAEYPGRIVVKVETTAQGVCLAVTDNGCGIPEDTLGEIREAMAHEEGSSERFFALVNIANRLRSRYGDQARIQIDSAVGQGTRVQMDIPEQEQANQKGG